MSVKELTADNFNDQCKLTDSSGCMFVLFYMPNCPWCIAVKPVFDRVADQHAYTKLGKFDVTADYNRTMVGKLRTKNPYGYTLPSFPTMVLFIRGEPYCTYGSDKSEPRRIPDKVRNSYGPDSKEKSWTGNRSVEDFGKFLMSNTARGDLCK